MLIPDLSLTEQRIVSMLAAGRTKQEVAVSVGLDEKVVEWHLARARLKLARAAGLALSIDEAGMVDPGEGGNRERFE